VRGQRVVDDGDVVTSAGILSSIDGTLHVLERLAGPSVAAEAAAAVGWRHYRADPPVADGLAAPDVVAVLNAGFRWNPPEIGVLLTEGVGEIALASVFDVHGGQSLTARTLALSGDGGPVRSRHGLTFLPRAGPAGAGPRLDRVLVPGVAPAAAGVPPPPGGPVLEYVHDRPGFAFDASLRDLARSTDVATARWTAKVLELPTAGLVLAGPAWPWSPTVLLAVLTLLSSGHRPLLRRGDADVAERAGRPARPGRRVRAVCRPGQRDGTIVAGWHPLPTRARTYRGLPRRSPRTHRGSSGTP